jgi:hypothetical protein
MERVEVYITDLEVKIMKLNKSRQGKRNKINGANFERKVRHDYEARGYFVAKWTNQVDLENNKLIPSKHKFNFFTKVMSLGSGFPDFIAFREETMNSGDYTILGIEAKINGYLDKEEKEKARWLLQHRVFNRILIAKKIKEGRHVIPKYEVFNYD